MNLDDSILYILKPYKESKDKGWWHLKWRLIKHTGSKKGTWNLYRSKQFSNWHDVGIRFTKRRHSNYGYAYNCFVVTIFLWWTTIEFWIKRNFTCIESGPNDHGEQRPLDLPTMNQALEDDMSTEMLSKIEE